MRKLTGLCFLTATLLAGAANAQGVFIEQGDPSAISAAAVYDYRSNATLGGSAAFGYTYRGVLDMGLNFSAFKYSSGDNSPLVAWWFKPYIAWHAIRSDVMEGMPVSIAFGFGFEKRFYSNNGPVASPDGYAAEPGMSIYRRIEMGSVVFAPELYLADDISYTRYYSKAQDQASGNKRNDNGLGYSTSTDYMGGIALLRANLMFGSAKGTSLIVLPYAGYRAGLAAGLGVGAMF